MNKQLILIFIIIATSFNTNAQELSAKIIGNISGISSQNDVALKAGGGFGLSYNYQLSDKIDINSGLSYNWNRYRTDTDPNLTLGDQLEGLNPDSTTSDLSKKTRFNTLHLPIQIRFFIYKKLYVSGGFHWDRLFNQESTGFLTSGHWNNDESIANNSFGINLGMGFKLEKFAFDLIFDQGLVDIVKIYNQESKEKLMTLKLGVLYTILKH